ncbi:BglG family transcription antiterminator [Bacillus alveayuensis]|uniref:BglG family transcription antiterminator n=1 Tax=Aeribacillus alveayuensis TaxID=279215 RepID=UPI0005D12D52|nr:BglG family transcription antiterminator [Bacillus alveayuensis]
MYISARERKILDVLLSHEKGITVGELAEQLDVSNRTIHRDLKGIERILEKYELRLVKKAGVGIQVIGEEHQKKELQIRLFHLSHTEYTPEERQTMILIALLEAAEPVKLISLANDLNVTVATISNDLDKIQETLEKHGLSLIRKRGYGVEIAGSESAKRKMMSELLFYHFDESEFLSFMKESILKKSSDMMNTVTEKLLGLVDKKKLFTIEKQIEKMKAELPFMIADSSYVALVIHLALAIERIMQGEPINFEAQYLETICATKEYETAEKIAKSLEEAFHITIPKEEIGYITMHLMGAKLRDRQGYMLEEASLEIGRKVQELIRFVSKELYTDLTNDFPLYEDLVIHLKPALYRIQHNMGITNPLLEKIVQDYCELFSIVEKGMNKVFSDVTVPKEEIGYVVLHFASALLREKNGLHALVICSSGLGTAKILATRLKKEIPDISYIEQKSFFELRHVDASQYDLIVSTVPIHTFTEPYFVVSPMLQEDEVASIRQFLKNKKAPVRKKQVNASGNTIQKMSSIHVMSETIVQLLNGFTVQPIQANSLREVLAQACHQLWTKGIIQEIEPVLTELFNREKIGGLGIPETSLALYHARSSAVSRPSFTIYELSHEQTVMGMDNKPMNIKRVLLLLAPSHAPDEMLSVLSHMSSLIIKDDGSIELFSTGTEEQLHSFLSESLEKFFYEHL